MRYWIILFFILAILFYLYTYYHRLKYEKKQTILEQETKQLEAFENYKRLSSTEKLLQYHNTTLQFKNALDASKLINPNSPYLTAMNQPNLTARDCTSQDELFAKYANAFDDITANERNIVNTAILKLLNTIQSRNTTYYKYLIFWINKIYIAKAKKWLEGGMPHTLEDTIIMDANWFTQPRMNTFIHEITHVHQRQTPFEFDELYTKLGYKPIDIASIKGLENVLQLNRNNPDGLSAGWIWHLPNSNTTGQWWWIGALFNTATPMNMSDISNVALKLEMDSNGNLYYLKQQATPLYKVKEFTDFFGENPNNYHPNEMAAKFAEWFLNLQLATNTKDDYQNEKYEKYVGFNIFMNYFNEMINIYYL